LNRPTILGMDRRRFLLTSLAGALAAPLGADSQVSTKIARIGMLRSENRPLDERIRQNIADVRAGLQDEGYAEGQHYRIDYYAPTSDVDVVRLARTLVRDKVDVIHAIAHVAIEAARKATTTIPIVAHDYEPDPIAAGFVATLAKPGGNITGMFLDLPDISGKLLELIKTTLPGLRRIEVFWDPLTGKAQVLAVERAAKVLGIEINIIEARPGVSSRRCAMLRTARRARCSCWDRPSCLLSSRRLPRPRRPLGCRLSLSFPPSPG
jgi:putative tryptophan/tyrosine transport system substrate-binding protein